MNKLKNIQYPLLFIVLCLSITALCNIFALPVQYVVLYSGCILIAIAYQYSRTSERSTYTYIYVIMLILIGVIGLSFFRQGAYVIYNAIVGVYEMHSKYAFPAISVSIDQSQYTWYCTILLVYVFSILYIVCMECMKKHKHLTVFILSGLPFFPTLFYNIPQVWIFTIPLLAYWISLFWCSNAFRNKIQPKNILMKPFFLCLCMISILFLIVPQQDFTLNSGSHQIRETLLKKINTLFHTLKDGGQKSAEINLNDEGNRSYSGETQLKVTSKDHDRMYLKTFTGEVYEDNTWKTLPDSAFANISDQDVASSFTIFRDTMSSNTPLSKVFTKKPSTLRIQDERADTHFSLIPYFYATTTANLKPYHDAYMTGAKKISDFTVWNMSDFIAIDLPKMPLTDPAYTLLAYKQYTKVPKNLVPVFKQLLSKNSKLLYLYSLSDNKGFAVDEIRKIISKQTTYTLTPGKTPKDKDFVDYFLNDNKKGYCVHYATTATLLLRYLGIPARYAEGYVVNEDNYKGDVATIPDQNAHAWVEVFEPYYGWIPYEVTPPAAFDPSSIQANIAKNNNVNENKKHNHIFSNIKISLLMQIFCLVILIFGIFLQRKLRLLYRKRSCLQSNHRIAIIKSYSCLRKIMDITQIDYQIQAICNKAMYSNHDMTYEEVEEVYTYTIEQSKKQFHSLKFYQKPIYLFWKAFI